MMETGFYIALALYIASAIILFLICVSADAFEDDRIAVLLSIIFWPVVVVGALIVGAYDVWLDWRAG